MKSPIYGGGRNRKHRAVAGNRSAANVNLRGKKYRVMECNCCYCIDIRDELRYKEHMKEVKDYKNG